MKDIITFCGKTITELKAEIKNIEKNLKTILENNTFQKVQNTIDSNQNIRDRFLKQRKLKKFNHLKYGPRQTQQYSSRDKESTREDQTTEKRDKFRTQQLLGKVTVKQTYFGKRATQISEYLLINHQVMKTTKHQFHNK